MSFFKPVIMQGSYSRIKDWEKCPRLAQFKHIHKIKEAENPAMLRGKELHSQAEQYIKGGDPQADPPMALWNVQEYMREYAGWDEPQCELQLAVNDQWEPTGWFDKDVYLRAVVDLLSVSIPKARIVDHKSGKIYDEHPLQAELYACFGFAGWKEVDEVEVQFNYIDQGTRMNYTFTRDQYEALRAKWDEKMTSMRNDDVFPTNPGRHCRWCNFSKAKGGPCEHGG